MISHKAIRKFRYLRYVSFLLCAFFTLQLSACSRYSLILPSEEDLNLDGYELVFCDEFDGDSLDYSVWESRFEGARRSGFNDSEQIAVKDGNLILTAEYKKSEYGEGRYSAMIQLKELYAYGYYEIRCIANSGEDFWSAFWLQSDNSYSHEDSQGGIYGAEIDIFETYKNHTLKTKDYVTSCIHCNGFDDDEENIDRERVAKT